MILSYLKMAMGDIVHRKKRSALTMIGIFIGVVAVVSLISIGEGLQNSITEQFQALGSDLIMVSPGSGMSSSYGPSQGGGITDHDIDLIKNVRGVDLVGGLIAKYASVELNGERKYTFVIGIPTDKAQDIVLHMQNIVVELGQQKFGDKDTGKVAIGYELAHNEFFKRNVGVKDKLVINSKEFKVATIIERLGNSQDDAQIYIPLEDAKEIFNESDNYYALMVSVKPGFVPDEVAMDIQEKMRKDRNLEKGAEDFSVQTYSQMLNMINSVLNIVQVVILGIAAISLLVGGIGIMNTMYTSVMERTNEIGIMKAIGARNSDILLIFLFESGMLGLMGGAIGCALGLGLAKLVQIAASGAGYAMLKVSINPYLILGTMLFSFLFGIISGLLPALRALKLKVVDALHYE